jgi:hypothetical protein
MKGADHLLLTKRKLSCNLRYEPILQNKINIMPLDETNEFAEAEILLDNDCFGSDAADSPVPTALPVATSYRSSTDSAILSTSNNDHKNTSTTLVTSPGTGRDTDTVLHNVQHKKNVVVGVVSGVFVGAVLLGPIGAVAGGFGGRAIVKHRERRWRRRQSKTAPAGPAFRVQTE